MAGHQTEQAPLVGGARYSIASDIYKAIIGHHLVELDERNNQATQGLNLEDFRGAPPAAPPSGNPRRKEKRPC